MTADSSDRERDDMGAEASDVRAAEHAEGADGQSAAEDPTTSTGFSDRLRADARTRRLATVGAIAVGLGLAWLHWVGVVVGAALCSLPQRSLRRGVLAGVGFGAIVVAVDLLVLAATGPAALAAAIEMSTLTVVTVAIGLIGGFVGGLVRGVV